MYIYMYVYIYIYNQSLGLTVTLTRGTNPMYMICMNTCMYISHQLLHICGLRANPSFLVLILGNSKSNHLGAQGTLQNNSQTNIVLTR